MATTLPKKDIAGYDGSSEPYVDMLGAIVMPGGSSYQGINGDPFSCWDIDASGEIYNIHTLHVFRGQIDTNTRANVPESFGPMTPPIKYHVARSGE